jgi:hypothetical protein
MKNQYPKLSILEILIVVMGVLIGLALIPILFAAFMKYGEWVTNLLGLN